MSWHARAGTGERTSWHPPRHDNGSVERLTQRLRVADVLETAGTPHPGRRYRGSMRHSCLANRLLMAAALGYVGAGPANSVAISWLAAFVAVVATYWWTARERRHGSTCALPHDVSTLLTERTDDAIRIETEQGQLQ